MAEKEYIEAKALDDFKDDIMDKFLSLCDYNDYKRLTLLKIGETIDKSYYTYVSKPLADVVEVVRCKDCILYEPKYLAGLQKNDNYGICTRYKFLTEEYSLRFETDFCSYGERKSEI